MTPLNTASAAPSGGETDPVSRPELERLDSLRRKAAPQRVLTPIGAESVKAQDDRRRDDRARHIERRLAFHTGSAASGFTFATLRSRAKHDFDRSR